MVTFFKKDTKERREKKLISHSPLKSELQKQGYPHGELIDIIVIESSVKLPFASINKISLQLFSYAYTNLSFIKSDTPLKFCI